jgi:transcriptional regulator with XRE-family HTH domain
MPADSTHRVAFLRLLRARLTVLPKDSTFLPVSSHGRTTLGPKFTEGSRRLWLLMKRFRWTQADAARALELDTGQLSRLLFGDRKPGLTLAQRLAGPPAKIKLTTWGRPPAKPFTPPSEDAEEPDAPAQLTLPLGATNARATLSRVVQRSHHHARPVDRAARKPAHGSSRAA